MKNLKTLTFKTSTFNILAVASVSNTIFFGIVYLLPESVQSVIFAIYGILMFFLAFAFGITAMVAKNADNIDDEHLKVSADNLKKMKDKFERDPYAMERINNPKKSRIHHICISTYLLILAGVLSVVFSVSFAPIALVCYSMAYLMLNTELENLFRKTINSKPKETSTK